MALPSALARTLSGTVALVAALAASGGEVVISPTGQRLATPVKSFLEMREDKLVRQGWDISCGAAALSTVLTHDFGRPYSEATIAVSILSNTDPERVRSRGGFSLLDLKRFAEAVGFSATGYGGLTPDDLAQSSVPVILAVRIRDFDHFVVYRGRFANRVLIGDPAFGNLTLTDNQLQAVWRNGIGFFVRPDGDEKLDGEPLSPDTMNLAIPDLTYVYRTVLGGDVAPPTRRARSIGAP